MRKLYIVSENYDKEQAKTEAKANDCPEIAFGIPPCCRETVSEKDLPYIYIENSPIPETTRLEVLKEKGWENLTAIEKNEAWGLMLLGVG